MPSSKGTAPPTVACMLEPCSDLWACHRVSERDLVPFKNQRRRVLVELFLTSLLVMSAQISTGKIEVATKNVLESTGLLLVDSNRDGQKPIMAGKPQSTAEDSPVSFKQINDSSGNVVSRPPTAMVAPLLDTSRPLSDHPSNSSPSSSPLVTRKARTRNVDPELSGEHKYMTKEVQLQLRGDIPATMGIDKLHNLMNILNEKSQIIER